MCSLAALFLLHARSCAVYMGWQRSSSAGWQGVPGLQSAALKPASSLKPQAGCFKLPISVSMQPSTTAELQSARKCSSGLHSTAQQAVASLEQGDESRLSVRAGSPLRRRG